MSGLRRATTDGRPQRWTLDVVHPEGKGNLE